MGIRVGLRKKDYRIVNVLVSVSDLHLSYISGTPVLATANDCLIKVPQLSATSVGNRERLFN